MRAQRSAPSHSVALDVYHEIRPAEPAWRERMELLNLRELLSVIAHFGPVDHYVARIRTVVKQFA